MNIIKRLLAAVAVALSLAPAAHAGPIATETWYLGGFGGIGSTVTGAGPAAGAINPGAPAWTFTIADTHMLSVYDCCALGDVFEIFDGSTSLGSTYVGTATCNSTAACDAGGAELSRGDFLLGAGTYSITMTLTAGPGGGNMFFIVRDVADVPAPATLLLAGIALLGLRATRRR